MVWIVLLMSQHVFFSHVWNHLIIPYKLYQIIGLQSGWTPEPSRWSAVTSNVQQREQQAAARRVVISRISCAVWVQREDPCLPGARLSVWLTVRDSTKDKTASHDHGIFLTESIHNQCKIKLKSLQSVHQNGREEGCWALQQTCRARSNSHWLVSLFCIPFYVCIYFIQPLTHTAKLSWNFKIA